MVNGGTPVLKHKYKIKMGLVFLGNGLAFSLLSHLKQLKINFIHCKHIAGRMSERKNTLLFAK